jgi:hypothetical protein
MQDDEDDKIEQELEELAAEGWIVDSGERRWNEKTKTWQIVWETAPVEPTPPTRAEIEQAIKGLAEAGKLVDSGRRRWSEKYQEWQIVWVCADVQGGRCN